MCGHSYLTKFLMWLFFSPLYVKIYIFYNYQILELLKLVYGSITSGVAADLFAVHWFSISIILLLSLRTPWRLLHLAIYRLLFKYIEWLSLHSCQRYKMPLVHQLNSADSPPVWRNPFSVFVWNRTLFYSPSRKNMFPLLCPPLPLHSILSIQVPRFCSCTQPYAMANFHVACCNCMLSFKDSCTLTSRCLYIHFPISRHINNTGIWRFTSAVKIAHLFLEYQTLIMHQYFHNNALKFTTDSAVALF